jgi:hypothetical protein
MLSSSSPSRPRPFRLTRRVVAAIVLLFSAVAFAADDAERLSRRVPDQAYHALPDYALLDKGNIRWGIPLWSCSPANLKVIKVMGKTAPAPYAIEITVGKNERINGYPDSMMRLQSIHLLAASLADALKIRRALIAEIASMQSLLEKRQGNPPGYLKRLLESQNH